MPHPRDPDPSCAARQHPGLGVAPGADRTADDPPGLARPGSGQPDRRRGADDFVPVSWDEALDRLAAELRRVYAKHGPHAVFGGSYGWASAGRFHDAQHQLHRFLNLAGGYVRSVGSYSSGAASVILPHVIGPQGAVAGNNVSWDELVAESALVLAFGGMALKNNDVGGGGTSRHIARERLDAARRRGVEFHLIGPLRDDLPGRPRRVLASDPARHRCRADARPRAHAGRRGSARPRISRPLLHRLGEFRAPICAATSDGQPKTAAWAAAICGMPEADIVALARRIAGRRTLVTCSMSLQRAEHGEQPVWMAIVLAAILGQIGLPGGGFAFALGAVSNTGKPPVAVPLPDMPAGRNAIDALHPGGAHRRHAAATRARGSTTTARHLTYPDIRLVYWAGGNPFHHHQDLGRLRTRFAAPGHGRRARIRCGRRPRAMPTSSCRRRSRWSARTSAPPPAIRCWSRCTGPSRPTARRATTMRSSPGSPSGSVLPSAFTEGRSPRQWLEHIYEPTRHALAERGHQRAEFRRVLGRRRVGAADRAVGRRHRARLPPRPRRAPSCRPRAAGSRSPRRRSPASTIPTAPAIRPGWRRSRR